MCSPAPSRGPVFRGSVALLIPVRHVHVFVVWFCFSGFFLNKNKPKTHYLMGTEMIMPSVL